MSLLFSLVVLSPVVCNWKHVRSSSSQLIDALLTDSRLVQVRVRTSRQEEEEHLKHRLTTSQTIAGKSKTKPMFRNTRELGKAHGQTFPSYKLIARIPRLALSGVNRSLNAPAKQGGPWSATNSLIACNACSPLPAPERSNGGGRAASNGDGRA
jgi:hypothetical protein